MYPVRAASVCHQQKWLNRGRCLLLGLQLTKDKQGKRRHLVGGIRAVDGQEERHFGGEECGEG